MGGAKRRLGLWINEAIQELTTFDRPKRRRPESAARPPLPSALSLTDVPRQESRIQSASVDPQPKSRRVALPGSDARTRQAAKVVNKSKEAVFSLFEDVRLGRSVEIKQLAPVVSQLASEVERNATALLEVLRLKNKSEYTYVHSVAVSAMMLLLGRAMGYEGDALSELGMAGLLHDIGKMGVPSRILDKPGRLSDVEFAAVKGHPLLGYDMLLKMPGIPDVARNVCLAHHEKVDGSGYPYGHAKDKISIAARMGAICDVYDALTSDRAYKAAWSPDKTLRTMRSWTGHFDRDILALFMQSLGIFPVGSLVSVRGTSLGIVVDANPAAPSRPVVRTFYSIERQCRVPPEDVAIGADGILAIQDPAAWPIGDWKALVADIGMAEEHELRIMPARL